MSLLRSLLLFLLAALAALADKPIFTVDNLPTKWEQGQIGTNKCDKWAPHSPHARCQNLFIASASDFCLWSPVKKGAGTVGTVGDLEEKMVSWCTRSGYGTRLIPKGTLKAAHFLKTPDFYQITGYGDFTKTGIQANDDGGELDRRGADGRGNPPGGIVFVLINGKYVEAQEWSNFMSATEFSIRACFTDRAADLCPHIYDEMGSQWNHPGDYGPGFSYCESDSGPRPGWFHGKQWFQHQKPEPKGHKAPPTRNCHKVKESLLSGHRSKWALFKGKGSKRDVLSAKTDVGATVDGLEDFEPEHELLQRESSDSGVLPEGILDDVEELEPVGRVLDHTPLRRDGPFDAAGGVLQQTAGTDAATGVVGEVLKTVDGILEGRASALPAVSVTDAVSDVAGEALKLVKGVAPVKRDGTLPSFAGTDAVTGLVDEALSLVDGGLPIKRDGSLPTVPAADAVTDATGEALKLVKGVAPIKRDGTLPTVAGTDAVTGLVDEAVSVVDGGLPIKRDGSLPAIPDFGSVQSLLQDTEDLKAVGRLLDHLPLRREGPTDAVSGLAASTGETTAVTGLAGEALDTAEGIIEGRDAADSFQSAKDDPQPEHEELAEKPFKFNKIAFGATAHHQARGHKMANMLI